MNRFSAFILAAAVAPGVFAQDFDSGGLNFSVLSGDAGTCIVTGANTEIEGVLDIPAVVTYDGVDYTVTEIGEWAFSYKGLYGINFPSTLEVIRSCAFFNFYGLSDLVFPDSLKEIQYQAFYACSELRNVNLGTGVMTIGESAFGETNLGIVKSGNEVPPVLETSFDDIFPHVGAVAVPSSLVAAYSQAWAGANVVPDIAATSLSIEPSSVKVMPGDSFKINAIVEPADAPVFFLNNNRDVLNVDKDGNVSTDPYSANYWGSVTVSTLNGLEESCQIEVADFNSFSVDGVRYALMNGSDTEVMISGIENELPSVWTVPASVEHDGKAYSVVAMTQNIAGWRQELEEVVIPSTMRYIGKYNFYGCDNLKSVTIEDGMEPLEIAANGEVFASSGVTRFYLGRNLTGGVPRHFEYLERLTLGENVTSLPAEAFNDTSRLALVESLNPEPPVLGENALGWNTWNITVVVPAGSEDAYRNAWGDRFSNITSPVEATSITLTQSALTLYTGQEPQLELTVEPAGATVIWTSSDSNIVGVSQDGRLSYWSDSEGVITITASTLNGLSAECEVTASRWFHFPEESVTIEPGSIKQLSVTDMAPAIADSSVTWRTEWGEDVAAVNESGLLRGLTYGDSYVYAEVEVPDMGPRGYGLPVYVRDFPQSVELTDTVVNVFLNNGGRKDIEVRFEPEGENVSHNIVWTVDNPEVAEIRMENYGEIRYYVEAKSLGDTKFKGVSPNGLTVGGLIRVMNEIQNIEVSPSIVYIEPGDTCTLKWTTTPVETNQQVVWESVNPEIATVDENGVVTGVAYGHTSLVATLLDDWGYSKYPVDVNVCILPESVTLVNDSIVFTSLWNQQNLNLSFTPDEEEVCKDIVWTVENPDVAWIGYYSDFNEEGH